jgi:tetratricopeptide (TPR) repeat protein
MGKSLLARSLVASVPTAMAMRCFEGDWSAYAGLDEAVLELLNQPERGEDLPPDEARALRTLFPAAVASGAPWPNDVEPARVRTLAADGVRRLLRARCGHATPVVVVDDGQWGGRDLGRLLSRVLEAPMLVVTVERPLAGDRGMLPALDEELPPSDVIELGPLREDEVDDERMAGAVRAAAGHPFFVSELLRAQSLAQGVDLKTVIGRRLQGLPTGALPLLRLLAAAERPLARSLLMEAHDVLAGDGRDPTDASHATTALLRERLALVHQRGPGEASLQVCHALVARVCLAEHGADGADGGASATDASAQAASPEHAALDDAMTTLAVEAPGHQARHARLAGRHARAAALYGCAAEHAMRALAFDRAATHCASRVASATHAPDTGAQALAEHHEAHGHALAAAGRHGEAAQAYRRALDAHASTPAGTAKGATTPQLDLARREAEHLLHAGQMEAGRAALVACLRAAQLPYHTGQGRMLTSLLWSRAVASRRGPVCPVGSGTAPAEAQRIDLCFSAALAFTNIDSLRGADYALRSLERARRVGDRRRFARAYALVAAYSGSGGERVTQRVQQMLEDVRAFSVVFDDDYLRAMGAAGECLRRFHIGDHAGSLAFAESIERDFGMMATCARERVTAQVYRCANLSSLGRYAELRDARQELERDSVERNDLFGWTHARLGLLNLVHLVDDEAPRAEAHVREAMSRWTDVGFQLPHFFALVATCRAALYRGDPQLALAQLEEAAPAVRRALVRRVPYIDSMLWELEARATLSAAFADSARAHDARRVVRRAVKGIRRHQASCFFGLADTLTGGLHLLEGRKPTALGAFEQARRRFDAHQLKGHVDALGLVIEHAGGEDVRALAPADRPRDRPAFSAALSLAPP